jgi:hypothetical protein
MERSSESSRLTTTGSLNWFRIGCDIKRTSSGRLGWDCPYLSASSVRSNRSAHRLSTHRHGAGFRIGPFPHPMISSLSVFNHSWRPLRRQPRSVQQWASLLAWGWETHPGVPALQLGQEDSGWCRSQRGRLRSRRGVLTVGCSPLRSSHSDVDQTTTKQRQPSTIAAHHGRSPSSASDADSTASGERLARWALSPGRQHAPERSTQPCILKPSLHAGHSL